ncbi:putative mitochondrial protein, partial [Mucuna pruriens]
MMPNTTYGMIRTYGDFVRIKLFIGEFLTLRSIRPSDFCHTAPRGSHYGSTWTARKVLDCRFYWPTIFRDTYQFISTCEKYQKAGVAISRRHEMPQQPISFYEVFNVWGIDFMVSFLVSNGYSYILLAIDYVSRWVEAIATKNNDAKVVVDFLKSNIFCQFGVLKVLIKIELTLRRLRKIRNTIVNISSSINSVINSDQFGTDHFVASTNIFTEPGQMENHDRTLKELATPDVVYQPWCIQYPQLEPTQTYELKYGLIHLLPKFHGLAREDPHKHLKEFHVVCSMMRPQGIPKDYIKMKAFPFSLDGAAKDWPYLQPALFNT